MANELFVVGVGPGNPSALTREAERAIESAGCVIAAARHMALAGDHKNVAEMKGFDATFERAERELEKHPVAILVSGDTGIFSLLPLIKKRFPDKKIKVIPGISSLSALCAELGETWDDALILSCHGREMKDHVLLHAVEKNSKTIIFCGKDKDPKWLCSLLSENGLDRAEVFVGERLGYDGGRVISGSPNDLAKESFDSLSIVLVKNPSPWSPPSSRLNDDEFVRSEVPMTKCEVRSVILDKLRMRDDAVFWDIGAGTGSICVSAALEYPDAEVHAVECDSTAAELERKNREKFRLHNLKIHHGRCPEAMKDLPSPTHVFVGGSGGAMAEILNGVASRGEKIRVVVSCVTLEALCETSKTMKEGAFADVEVVQIAVSRSKTLGASVIMSAQNPITIFSAWTNGRGEEKGE